MGKSAKFYKKPTLREREASKRASSVSANNPLSKAVLAERAKAEARTRAAALQAEALRSGNGQVVEERGKKKTGGARLKAKAAGKDTDQDSGAEIRTPRDAGIDYVAQWEGRRG